MSLISFVLNSGFIIYPMKSGFWGQSVTGKTVSLCTDGIIVLSVAQCVHHMLHLVATLSKQWQVLSKAFHILTPALRNTIKYVSCSQHASVHHTSTKVFNKVMNV